MSAGKTLNTMNTIVADYKKSSYIYATLLFLRAISDSERRF